jgi:YesN/AraC family two-component response regulator
MYKLLIVDDEAIEREAIQYFIHQAGWEFLAVEEAANGIQAVAKAVEMTPDIIIMDIRMPGKDGLEAAKEIREFNPNCKIIFLTAFHEFDYARKAIKVRAEDFIIKPAYSEDLLAVLTTVIAELDRGNNLATLPVAEAVTGDADSAGGPTALLMERVCRYIDQNYAKNIRLDEMCEMVGFSKYYFTRIFKQHKNMSLIDYITFRRVERTKELLRDPMISIKEISALVGFSEPNYLTAVFKSWEGLSPTEYRRKQCR